MNLTIFYFHFLKGQVFTWLYSALTFIIIATFLMFIFCHLHRCINVIIITLTSAFIILFSWFYSIFRLPSSISQLLNPISSSLEPLLLSLNGITPSLLPTLIDQVLL